MFRDKNENSFGIIYDQLCKITFDKPYSIFHFQTYDYKRENKFTVIERFLKNPTRTSEESQTMNKLFNKTQSVLNVFNKFYARHCAKKAIRYNCNLDLNLEPLFNLKEKNKFTFIHENTKFTFSNRDMLKIIKSGLLSHDNFFSNCHMPRNPYTNVEFTTCILYNFYFHLQDNHFKIPELVRRFFNEGFYLNRFLRKNDSYVRECIVDNYAMQLTLNDLYEEIIMFLNI